MYVCMYVYLSIYIFIYVYVPCSYVRMCVYVYIYTQSVGSWANRGGEGSDSNRNMLKHNTSRLSNTTNRMTIANA